MAEEHDAGRAVDIEEAGVYLTLYLKMLRLVKLWTTDGGGRMSRSMFVLVPAYLFYLGTSLAELRHNWGNLALITETMDMMLIFAVTFHKCLTLVIREAECMKLVHVVENNFFRPQQRRIPAYKAIVDKSTKRGSFVFYVWAAQSMGVLIALMFLPMGESLIRLQENNGTFHWRFPYRTWTPYDHFEGLLYAAMYTYHLFISSLQVIVIPAFDGFFIALLIHACGQFRILRDRLENLRQNCRKEMHKSKFGGREERITSQLTAIHSWSSTHHWDDETQTSPQLDLEMRTILVDCIDHHRTILEFLEQVEEIVSPVLLTQFLCSSIIICTSAFQLTVGNVEVVKMMTMAFLCCAALFELFMFCTFADEMQVESMAVGMSAYNSQWYYSSQSFKRLLSIVMLRARKRAKVTFGKFTDLSLETYASIVQICYTYFTILNRLNDDKPQ